jgi:hypothetical protein
MGCGKYVAFDHTFATGDHYFVEGPDLHGTRVNIGNAEGTFGVMAAQKKSMVTLAKIKLIEILFIPICLSNRKS